METHAAVKLELDKLVKEVPTLVKLLAGKSDAVLNFNERYQNWYTRALPIVGLLGRDRLAEFVSYYQIDPKRKGFTASTYSIQDFIMGIGPGKNYYSGDKPFEESNIVAIRIFNQGHILDALASRIETVLSNVEARLQSELEDEELAAASKLVKLNVRAAGALAGVILERHLQRVAAHHKLLPPKRNPTISDLNEPLKEAGVYDLPTWRKIQLLADIRNLCSHQKSVEPTEAQVNELIVGINGIIKSVF